MEEEGKDNSIIIQEIKKLIEKIDVKKHFPKFTGDKMKHFMQGLGKSVMKVSDADEMINKFFIFSGRR